MCIIAYRPAGAKISTETLKQMFNSNSHGAGIMFPENRKIHIIKGLMSIEEFLDACASVPDDVPCVYHCRISSHGTVRPGLTHPFPVCSDLDVMEVSECYVNKGFAVAHNGIINGMNIHGDHSDTECYTRDVLAPLAKNSNLLSEKWDAIIEKTIDYSRLAIMNTKGTVRLYGSGWVKSNGCFFSNHSFEKPKPARYKYYRYSYDDDDWDVDAYIKSLKSHGWGNSL